MWKIKIENMFQFKIVDLTNCPSLFWKENVQSPDTRQPDQSVMRIMMKWSLALDLAVD